LQAALSSSTPPIPTTKRKRRLLRDGGVSLTAVATAASEESRRVSLEVRGNSPVDKLDATKPKAVSNEGDSDDENDDSSIEVLLTIQPPTPNKKAAVEATKKPPLEIIMANALPMTKSRTTDNDDTDDHTKAECSTSEDYKGDSAHTVAEYQVDTIADETNATSMGAPRKKEPGFIAPQPAHKIVISSRDREIETTKAGEQGQPQTTFSCLTSAYLQNLAEICHTMLEDCRWRVGKHNQSRLLAWERGDDLSAVIPLARRFRPGSASATSITKKKVDSDWCPGVFCHCHNAKEKHDSTAVVDRNNDTDRDQRHPDPEEATPEDRSFHLYCRMFYRKGPWFRIDDLYSRYYSPKKMNSSSSFGSSCGKDTDDTTGTMNGDYLSDKETADQQKPKMNSKHSFFDKPQGSATKKSTGTLINEDLFQQHLGALTIFFSDLIRLKEMGLIRSFCGEEECGKTVGWSNGLLTAEERRLVLEKLGAGKKKADNRARRFTDGTKTGASCYEERVSSAAVEENEIWKQMCRQKSISSQFTTTKGSKDGATVLLPVSRHVNQILLDKLAAKVVCSCSSAVYVPASVMKDYKRAMMDHIAAFIQYHTSSSAGSSLEAMLLAFETCVRLREAPLKSVQRLCRLFLCATSGPGQMRSDGGANGWKSILEVDRRAILSNTKIKNTTCAFNVEPPGAHSWHTTVFPGMQHRFGLASTCFLQAFQPLPSCDAGNEEKSAVQVFYNLHSFLCWEICVELRATTDYLIEINELTLYNERKRKREDGSGDEEYSGRDHPASMPYSDMDFHKLLSSDGRKKIVNSFVSHGSNMPSTANEIDNLHSQIERDVSFLFQGSASQALLKTEYEWVLCTMAVVIMNVLRFRIESISKSEILVMIQRPWLRHMSWEACSAYILWDIIPILERRGFYTFAIQSLNLLVQGSTDKSVAPLDQGAGPIGIRLPVATKPSSDVKFRVAFAHFLLSRRARGKALDRLAIDMKHLLDAEEKGNVLATGEETKSGKKKGANTKKTSDKKAAAVRAFTRDVLSIYVENAAISFSTIRTLARRLKQPLVDSLTSLPCREAQVLGMRLACSERLTPNPNKYSDWVPNTDHAIANSIAVSDAVAGGRCRFVGHEENQEESLYTKSLNVEELAMEFYGSGRLPAPPPNAGAEGDSNFIKGGWLGWHDEGGLVRALFRVLSFQILGMDWGCQCGERKNLSLSDQSTIFLSPYQGAPFDLHVGYELAGCLPSDDNKTEVRPNYGFYLRRQEQIEAFLLQLEQSSGQEMSDLVFKSIRARHEWNSLHPWQKDPLLEKDTLQCRTLSMLAAGFGGTMLASIFRCYFFDYRFFSGGLPDLLLVRARFASKNKLVDLGEWVGEAFDAEYLAELEAHQRANLLGDKDDDFLGCAKVGDSGGGGNARSRSSKRLRPPTPTTSSKTKLPQMPERLELTFLGDPVEVECMFVEVKSLNDKLDARQEDWLNILDLHGNARVCKFGKSTERSNS